MNVVTSLGSSNELVIYGTDQQDAVDYANEKLPEHQSVRAIVICRAILAYLKNRKGRDFCIPTERNSYACCDENTDYQYVVLGSPREGYHAGDILAVYRVDTRGKLKRLSRIPSMIKRFHREAVLAPTPTLLEAA